MKDPERPGLLASSASLTAAAVRFVFEVGVELWRRWKQDEAKARAWTQTPAAVRSCPRCNEIAFTPGQVTCTKCGALL